MIHVLLYIANVWFIGRVNLSVHACLGYHSLSTDLVEWFIVWHACITCTSTAGRHRRVFSPRNCSVKEEIRCWEFGWKLIDSDNISENLSKLSQLAHLLSSISCVYYRLSGEHRKMYFCCRPWCKLEKKFLPWKFVSTVEPRKRPPNKNPNWFLR